MHRQSLQQRNTRAQRIRKIDIASHCALGNGGDFGFNACHVREFVDAFAADNG